MANTYSKIYIHIIIAVSSRQNLIYSSWKNELYKYITGIIRNNEQKVLAINGVADHIHVLVSINCSCKISDLVKDIKSSSSKWINDKNLLPVRFEWQKGYAAFSASPSHRNNLIDYIKHQEEHHKRKTFRDEYIHFLKEYDIEFNEDYLLKDYGE